MIHLQAARGDNEASPPAAPLSPEGLLALVQGAQERIEQATRELQQGAQLASGDDALSTTVAPLIRAVGRLRDAGTALLPTEAWLRLQALAPGTQVQIGHHRVAQFTHVPTPRLEIHILQQATDTPARGATWGIYGPGNRLVGQIEDWGTGAQRWRLAWAPQWAGGAEEEEPDHVVAWAWSRYFPSSGKAKAWALAHQREIGLSLPFVPEEDGGTEASA